MAETVVHIRQAHDPSGKPYLRLDIDLEGLAHLRNIAVTRWDDVWGHVGELAQAHGEAVTPPADD